MHYEVSYDPEQDCVITSVSGEMTQEPVVAFFTEIAKFCKKYGCKRVLSEVSQAKVAASSADLYFMAQTLEKLQISRKLKRAVIVDQDHESFAFWETVCSNQGHGSVRIFPDEEEAKSWLFDK